MDGFLADITRSGLTAGKVVLLGLIGLNLFTFLLYGLDKYKSRHRMWRVPESTLLLFALAGGSLGAWIGMHLWYHKTLHWKFRIGVPLIIVLQVAAILAVKFYK